MKYERGDQIIQSFCRTVSPQGITSPFFNFGKFSKAEKNTTESWIMHRNQMNEEKFESSKFLKRKYTRGDQIIQSFCRIGSHQEIRSALFNLKKFSKIERNTTETCRMQWNEMNDKEFVSFKFLKRKYRRGLTK